MGVRNTVINWVQIVLMSTGVVFIAILLSLSLPQCFTTAPSLDLPSLWSGIQGWLRPPYLYFIINGIIITIAASSFLHHHPTTKPPHQHDVIAVSLIPEVVNGAGAYYGVVSVKDIEVVEEERESIVLEKPKAAEVVVDEGESERKSTVNERSTWNPTMTPPLARQKALDVEMAPEIQSERPPASSRFGHHRRPAKANSAEGGKSLRRVAKAKKQDTLESTWKAITEGRHMPLTRHLKKSDTWENGGRQINLLDDSFSSTPDRVMKSATFKERSHKTSPAVPKLKKEPSLSQDDLNRRVEAFINKFNEEMRLQRQQSMQQFMDKINRAAY